MQCLLHRSSPLHHDITNHIITKLLLMGDKWVSILLGRNKWVSILLGRDKWVSILLGYDKGLKYY